MTQTSKYPLRDATSLTQWTRWSLYAQIAITCVALYSSALEYSVLVGLRDGSFGSETEAMAAAEASDARQGMVALVQLVILVVSGFLILRWIHRANWNARALGAQDLKVTPGWAVGWYFVPFANLVKPYQAMREIWQASSRPSDWKAAPVPQLVGLWWGLWLLYGFAGNYSFRLAMRADGIHDLINANVATIVSDVVTIPLCLALLVLVARIVEMQRAGGPVKSLHPS